MYETGTFFSAAMYFRSGQVEGNRFVSGRGVDRGFDLVLCWHRKARLSCRKGTLIGVGELSIEGVGGQHGRVVKALAC